MSDYHVPRPELHHAAPVRGDYFTPFCDMLPRGGCSSFHIIGAGAQGPPAGDKPTSYLRHATYKSVESLPNLEPTPMRHCEIDCARLLPAASRTFFIYSIMNSETKIYRAQERRTLARTVQQVSHNSLTQLRSCCPDRRCHQNRCRSPVNCDLEN